MLVQYNGTTINSGTGSVVNTGVTGPEVTKTIQISITNTEATTLEISNLILSNASYSHSLTFPLLIASNTTSNLTISFITDNEGVFNTGVNILSNNSTTPDFSFSLEVTVYQPELKMYYQSGLIDTEAFISIGTVALFSSTGFSINLVNEGLGHLLIHRPRVTAGYLVTETEGIIIPPGESYLLTPSLITSTPFSNTGYLFFNTNQLNKYSIRLALQATVTENTINYVTSNADTGTGSLREIIATSSEGSVIAFDSSLANQTINLNSQISIGSKGLVIDGFNAPGLIISGQNLTRIFSFSGVRHYILKHLTLQNGVASGTGNTGAGGAIFTAGSVNLTLINCQVKDNTCNGNGGAGIWLGNTTAITTINSTFDNNDASACTGERGGGAIANNGNGVAYSKNCNFLNNKGINGGGLNFVSTLLVVEDCEFISNDTSYGAVINSTPRGWGGAVYLMGVSTSAGVNQSGTIYVENSIFKNNIGAGRGGGCLLTLFSKDRGYISSCLFEDNLVIKDYIQRCEGGGLRLSDNPVLLRNSSFINNRAHVEGGGLWSGRDINKESRLVNCTFSGNIARSSDDTEGLGGAACLYNKTSIFNCTFLNNEATVNSACLHTNSQAIPLIEITNSIFSNNFLFNSDSPDNQSNLTFVSGGPNIQFPSPTNTSFYIVQSPIQQNPNLRSLIKAFNIAVHIPYENSPVIDTGVVTPYNYDTFYSSRPLSGVTGNSPLFDLGAIEYQIPDVSSISPINLFTNSSTDITIPIPNPIDPNNFKIVILDIPNSSLLGINSAGTPLVIGDVTSNNNLTFITNTINGNYEILLLFYDDNNYIITSNYIKVEGIKYYVSKSGLDTNTGLSINDSVLTINQAISLASPGDIIYIREGQYSEFININNKDSLTILPYENEHVTVTAYDLIANSSWVIHEPGVYKVQLDSTWNLGLGRNDIYSTSMDLQEARWPKISDRLDIKRSTCAISTAGANTSGPLDGSNNYLGYYRHPDLTSLPNMTGARVLFSSGREQVLRSGEVMSHSTNQIDIKYIYNNNTNDALSADDPFILWNKYELLTQELDYFFDTVTNILYVKSDTSPTNVWMRKRDRVFFINANNVTLDSLYIKGRIEPSVNSSNVLFNKLDISRGYKNWLLSANESAVALYGLNHIVRDCIIYDTGGTFLFFYSSGHLVEGNIFHHDGYASSLSGIQVWNAESLTFTRNTIHSTIGSAITIPRSSDYSYNHIYNIGNLITSTTTIRSSSNIDLFEATVRWNHIHDIVAYKNDIGQHIGGNGIIFPAGASNYKIYNNLLYNLTNLGITIGELSSSQVNFGNAQIYVVNNTVDRNLRFNSVGTTTTGYQGCFVQNNLALNYENSNSVNLPPSLTFTNNFLTRKEESNNLTGFADLKNWIPNNTSSLINAGTIVSGITTTSTPNIGWVEEGDTFVWGGSYEENTLNLSTEFSEEKDRFIVTTIIPGRSLKESVRVRVNSNSEYSIKGRLLNSNHTVSHFFDILEQGDLSIDISFDEGINYQYLTNINRSFISTTEAYIQLNELVIKGSKFITRNTKALNLELSSNTLGGGDIIVLNVDTSNISNDELSSIRIINKVNGSLVSYWLEDIETTNRKYTPLHLTVSTLIFNAEGSIDIEILYGDSQIIPQPSLNSLLPQINDLIFSGSETLWMKSHTYKPLSGANEILITWPSYNNIHSFNQSTASYQPTYEENILNGWPGIRFNIDSLIGPSLGLDNYTLMVIYTAEENPDVNYPRLLSGGTPEGFDWTDGIQLLTLNDSNNKQLPGIQTNHLTYPDQNFDTITIGANYKNLLAANFKGYIHEIIIIKGSIVTNANRLLIVDYLRTKYGVYLQPPISQIEEFYPLSVQLGNLSIPTEDISVINSEEIRIPYNNEAGSFTLTVTNSNNEEASLNIVLGEMTVFHNTEQIPPDALLDFGITTINQSIVKTIRVLNNSESQNITLSNLILPEDYSLIGSFPSIISPLSEVSFDIQFNASLLGTSNKVISFESSDIPLFTFNVGAIVNPDIDLIIEYNSSPVLNLLDLGVIDKNQVLDVPLDIINNSDNSITISSIQLFSDSFILTTGLSFPLELLPGSLEALNINIQPLSNTVGNKEASLVITDNIGNTYTLLLSVSVEGVSLVLKLEEEIIPNESTIDCGATFLNQSFIIKNFTLSNVGNITLVNLIIELSNTTDFSILGSIPNSLNNGETISFTIQLPTGVEGSKSSQLTIKRGQDIEASFNLTGIIYPLLSSLISANYDKAVFTLINNNPTNLFIYNSSAASLAIIGVTSTDTNLAVNTALPTSTFSSNHGTNLNLTYNSSEVTIEEFNIQLNIEGTILGNNVNTSISVPSINSLPEIHVLALGAKDIFKLNFFSAITTFKFITIPNGIQISLNDVPVPLDAFIDPNEIKNLRIFSIVSGIYQIIYEVNGTNRTLDLLVQSGPLKALTSGIGYVPIPKHPGLYPSSPYWEEAGVYWVLFEGTTTYVESPSALISFPYCIFFLNISNLTNKIVPSPYNFLISTNTSTQILSLTGPIPTARFTRDIFFYLSTVNNEVCSIINSSDIGIILYRDSVHIGNEVYSLGLTPGIIRINIDPQGIRILNNGILKQTISSNVLWLSDEDQYYIKVNNYLSLQDLILTTDNDGVLIDSYLQRKYTQFGLPFVLSSR